MKKLLVLSLLFFSIIAQASYQEGRIILTNGDIKVGYIKSFQDDIFIKKGKTWRTEIEKFNLDNEFIKYKNNNEDDGFEEIATASISEIILVNKNNTKTIYRLLYAGGVNKDGMLEISKRKFWLPLLKEGAIEIYGFNLKKPKRARLTNHTNTNYYFIRYPEKKYAVSPLSELALFEFFDNKLLLKTTNTELKLLIPECPKAYQSIVNYNERIGGKKEKRKEKSKKRIV